MNDENETIEIPFTRVISTIEADEIKRRNEDLKSFTMAAMQGLLSNPIMFDSSCEYSLEWVAEKSIVQAKATIEALEKAK